MSMFPTSSFCLRTRLSDHHGATPLEKVQPFFNPKTRGEFSFVFTLNEASEIPMFFSGVFIGVLLPILDL